MTSTPYFAAAVSEPPTAATLRAHVPAHAVLAELLRQAQPGRRGRADRLLGTSPLSAEARSWYVGALGEQRVGAVLARLPAPWVVLHAVPVGKASTDIDHVVLGPAGVFTINTKHHPGKAVWVAGRTLLVAGQKQPYIPKAEGEAKAAATLLHAAVGVAVPVRPVLALVGLEKLTVRRAPERAHVLTERHLVRWLLAQPPVLAADELARLLRLAEKPTTWHPAPPPLPSGASLEERFRALHHEVRTARRTRTTWVGAAVFGGLSVLAGGGPDLVQAALRMLLPTP